MVGEDRVDVRSLPHTHRERERDFYNGDSGRGLLLIQLLDTIREREGPS